MKAMYLKKITEGTKSSLLLAEHRIVVTLQTKPLCLTKMIAGDQR